MNSITIDSTDCITTLCYLCAQAGTDKTPFNANGHRHPYTTPYSLLFEPLRYKPIKFGEVGISVGDSLHAWSAFFPKATIVGYDIDANNLTIASSRNFPNTTIHMMDANDPENIVSQLQEDTKDGKLFDVLIDDASHEVETQCTLLRNAFRFLNPGGFYIIEDIYRDRSIDDLEIIFKEIEPMVSFHTFILCEHTNRFSPGANNDKLFVLVKNDKTI